MKKASDFFQDNDYDGLLNYAVGLEFALSQLCKPGPAGPIGPIGPQGPAGPQGPMGR